MRSKFTFYSCSETGRQRETNQDSLSFDTKANCFVLADGMGGHNGGEIASAMAVHLCMQGLKGLKRSMRSEAVIKAHLLSLLQQVNGEILQASRSNPVLQGMGTTVVLGAMLGRTLHYCHIGDSRLYLFRDGLLYPLTQDHSLQQEMIDQHPEEMRTIQRDVPSNIVTRALGIEGQFHPSVASVELQHMDLLLVSSDGLHGAMDHRELEGLVRDNQQHLAALPRLLVERADALDGSDNISVLLVQVTREHPLLALLMRYWRRLLKVGGKQ